MNENNHRVAVIGLDGATFGLLGPWVNQGKLPNFKKLMDMGCWGTLESTFPPGSPPAWTSFMTGKNPGKHGIFHFIDFIKKDLRLVNSKRVGPGKVWNYLSTYGKKCIVLNVPLTYPPEPLKGGVMVTSMLTPPNKPFTYPEDLADKIKLNVGEYRIDVDFKNIKDGKDAYLKDIYKTTELRTRCAKYLLQNYPWDFFMMVYTSTDRLQHFFWDNRDAMLDYYIKLDEYIGELIECLGHNVSIIFVSDHGFRGIKQDLYLNQWLEKEGYLSSKKVWIRKKARIKWRWWELVEKEQNNQKGFFRTLFDSIHVKRKRVIDWKATRAFYIHPGGGGGCYINLKGRSETGIVSVGREYETLRDEIIGKLMSLKSRFTSKKVFDRIPKNGRNETGIVNTGREYETLRDEIIGKLRDLKSPLNGKKVFDKILKKEDVYNGPCLNIAPDILLEFSDDSMTKLDRRLRKKKLFKNYDEGQPTSAHSLYGMFLITGPFVKKGANIKDLKIQDIAPTIMYLMGLPIPEDMDGKVPKDALDVSYFEQHPLRYEKMLAEEQNEVDVYSKEDEQKVKARLEDLGYL